MYGRIFIVLCLISLMIVVSCDSESTPKYLEFGDNVLLPQAPVGTSYEFTFTVKYGKDIWNESTGYIDSEIIWTFDSWKLNGVDMTTGPTNMTFSEGKITGTSDTADIGLWSFDVTIQLGKKTVVEKFYLPITKSIEIISDSVLPLMTTDIYYSTYFDARFGTKPFFWSFDNWTKNGSAVNDGPIGINLHASGYMEGKTAHSEFGHWTVDVTVHDSSIPTQYSVTKTFELDIELKIEVPTNYPTIQAAVDIAEDFDIVYLAAGTFKGQGNRDVDFGGKSLTILGDPQAPDTVIIDCEGSYADPHRAFKFDSEENNCVIDGVTITNGQASIISSHHRGGAIYCLDYVELTIQNCIFKENQTDSQTSYIYGGSIYIEDYCQLSVVNTQFIDNKATCVSADRIYGSTLYSSSNSKVNFEDVTITGSIVENGSSYLYGGEFSFSSVEYSFKNVTIKNGKYTLNNYYYMDGGILFFSSCSGVFENVNIVNNAVIGKNSTYVYQRGSIGQFSSCTSEFKNCVFANNTYEYVGSYTYFYNYGLFYIYNSTSKWSDCIFSQNELVSSTSECRYWGGIMYIYSNKAQIDRCHFLMNTFNSTPYNSTSTSYYAGGIRTYSSADAVINDCVFAYNKASKTAGALSNSYSSATMTVNNTTIYKNQGGMGGGIFNYGTLTVNNSVIWGNSGSAGGNQIYNYSGTVTLANSCYSNQSGDIYSSVNPTSCVNSDPYFKDTGDNPVTGDCTFSDVEMTVTGTPGTSTFTTEIKRGDMIYLTSDGETKALAVTKVVSDSELEVAGYYKGTPGTGVATVKKMDFTPQHTSKGDANDSPCVDAGDNSKSTSSVDIAGNNRFVDGNGNSTATIDMGAYELQ